ncbi:MAG TPA: hypothetical protein ENK82_06280 [Campylobacterales bacterium]|nr:hypothetical protein [Campylobacterales bacterium]HHS92937.1 hypothetical protein [Campylobacterales bacterium]
MQSTILKKHLLNLIHFECEEMNYFERPFSSDFESIICNPDDQNSWCTMDSSVSDKPITIVLDLEATALGIYTGGVHGFYLLDININELKTYEGSQEIEKNAEYFSFNQINYELLQEVDSPIDESSFGYAEGFKEKILALLN